MLTGLTVERASEQIRVNVVNPDAVLRTTSLVADADGFLALEPRLVRGAALPVEDLERQRAPARPIADAVHRPHAARARDALDLETVCEDVARLHGPVTVSPGEGAFVVFLRAFASPW